MMIIGHFSIIAVDIRMFRSSALPFLNSPGRYSIRGSTIRLELSDHQVVEGRFQIEGDVLTITSPSGPGYQFRRY